jgi:hypothetical protein
VLDGFVQAIGDLLFSGFQGKRELVVGVLTSHQFEPTFPKSWPGVDLKIMPNDESAAA